MAETDSLEAEEEQPQEEAWVEEEEVQPRAARFGWLIPALALLAIIGWTGFFAWVNQRMMLYGSRPELWLEWIVDWAVPVVLIIGCWLLATRNSRREAARFGATAHMLSEESARLEHRLSTVNRELSLARDFIAAQSRDLESLGRVAAERLSTNADRLQALVRDNGEQVWAIAQVSTTALENMDRLRDGLPVISNSARDVASQIGQAGNTAQEQLDALTGGFARLNEMGEASNGQVENLRARVDEAVAAFGEQANRLGEIADERFALLTERSAAFRADLDGREVEAIAAIRRRAAALEEELAARGQELQSSEESAIAALRDRMETLRGDGETLIAHLRDNGDTITNIWTGAIESLEERMIAAIRKISGVDEKAMDNARRRLAALSDEAQRIDDTIADRMATFETEQERRLETVQQREAAELDALIARLQSLDAKVAERQEEQLVHLSGLAERGEALADRLGQLSDGMAQLSNETAETEERAAAAAEGLVSSLENSRHILATSGAKLHELTDASVRLLEIIRSGAAHTEDQLPAAIGAAERRLTSFEERAQSLTGLIGDAEAKGASLAAHVEQAERGGAATLNQLASLDTRLAELASRSEAMAQQARTELAQAVGELEAAAAEILHSFQSNQSEAIRAIAENVGSQGKDAIERALRRGTSGAVAELEAAAKSAAEAGRDTAVQLRDQLAKVNELAGNLEYRVAHAREQAEEQVDNDFARRMALITESLNSSAIDITKAFDNEVTDTAWASYLRGDRGIFTRRAVKLIDNHETRAISDIYQEDPDFRETVNRYIHDFEAMLRNVLSTRDGNAMAVTLLSSDMGKLYVVLAQAIERLRS